LSHVADCILNGQPLLVDAREGRRRIEFIEAIYEAARTGQRVRAHSE